MTKALRVSGNELAKGTTMHDLVIRNGLIVDGTGAPAREADLAIDDGVVSLVGEVDDLGREEIDAAGMLVTPGFVDIHTHFDGQITLGSAVDAVVLARCDHGRDG